MFSEQRACAVGRALRRRLDFIASAFYIIGDVGFSGDDNGYATTSDGRSFALPSRATGVRTPSISTTTTDFEQGVALPG